MKVLFLCKANAERSQMAETFFNSLSRRNKAFSAGIVADKRHIGWPPGRIVTELMLSLGYNEFEKGKQKQLTEKMAKKANMIVVLLSKSGRRKYVPEYIKRCNDVLYWDVGHYPRSLMASFPPITYKYHIAMLLKTKAKVERLVKKIG